MRDAIIAAAGVVISLGLLTNERWIAVGGLWLLLMSLALS
jgi:hypothetical protein